MKTQILVTAVVAALALAAWAGSSTLWRVDGANDSLLVSGNIEAHESVVSFKAVQSRVVALPFEEGQWVKEGTLLARLDDADYRQQVAIDEAAIRVKEQQLASAKQKLEAARATLVSDRADLEQKQIDLARNQKLWEEKVITADQRDRTETALKQSEAVMRRDLAMQRGGGKRNRRRASKYREQQGKP